MKEEINNIQQQSFDLISRFNKYEISLPAEFQEVTTSVAQGEIRLSNRFICLNDIGEIRSVVISSAKINIFNFMFYPEPQRPLPCYAAEFVVLSGKPIVAVLDAKCLLDSDLKPHVEAIMMTARQGIKYRAEENPLPEWFEHWKSGFEILVRPKTLEKMSGLLAIHLHIWESITRLFNSDVDWFNHENASLHDEIIVNYKRQHAINYPGFPLLNRSFSNIWTTTYVGEYLFG